MNLITKELQISNKYLQFFGDQIWADDEFDHQRIANPQRIFAILW
jgi:hypothetical protein